jgi:hypothetical protein
VAKTKKKTSARAKKLSALKAKERARRVKKETFSLSFPKPREKKVILSTSTSKPIHLEPVSLHEKKFEQRRKFPHFANAVLAGAAIALASFLIFFFLIKVEWWLALLLCVPLFTGFSILIYNILEEKAEA